MLFFYNHFKYKFLFYLSAFSQPQLSGKSVFLLCFSIYDINLWKPIWKTEEKQIYIYFKILRIFILTCITFVYLSQWSLQLLYIVELKPDSLFNLISCFLQGKCDSNGFIYNGSVATTVSNKSCERWSNACLNHAIIDYSKITQDDENYCRNPGGYREQPWCFVNASAGTWEFCNVSKCPGMTIKRFSLFPSSSQKLRSIPSTLFE